MTQTLWAESALLANGWADGVSIEVGNNGNIESILTGTICDGGDRHAVIIPGIANVHSHAHQRAMAGLGERAGVNHAGQSDSFWSWRQIMYHYLERIQPEHLCHIASQVYVEMLKHGYTCVGEFQYLHHDVDGTAYPNPAEMTLQCLAAAERTGIGFTALPVLYRYGGFGKTAPLDGQKRFINDADGFCAIVDALHAACKANPNCSLGIAPHSLRAVDVELLQATIDQLEIDDLAAIHIHIAEQIKEVEDCIAWSGKRPVRWLFDHFEVDRKWCLVHATHLDEDELRLMADSGCVAGLCPTTEANLGDGFFKLSAYIERAGHWAIGSDSHISIDPVEELRWLEYGLRLLSHARNVVTTTTQSHCGRQLLDASWQGGALACGRKIGKIATGYRADFVVLDGNHSRLYGRHRDSLLDSWIFSGNQNLVKHVYVGGRRVIEDGYHADEQRVAEQYRRTLDELVD